MHREKPLALPQTWAAATKNERIATHLFAEAAGEGGAKHIRPGLPPAFVRESTRTKRTGWNEKRRKERENISSSVRVVIVLQVMYVCPSELTTDARINMPENSQAGRSFVVCILGSVVIDRNPITRSCPGPSSPTFSPASVGSLFFLPFHAVLCPSLSRPVRSPSSLCLRHPSPSLLRFCKYARPALV